MSPLSRQGQRSLFLVATQAESGPIRVSLAPAPAVFPPRSPKGRQLLEIKSRKFRSRGRPSGVLHSVTPTARGAAERLRGGQEAGAQAEDEVPPSDL